MVWKTWQERSSVIALLIRLDGFLHAQTERGGLKPSGVSAWFSKSSRAGFSDVSAYSRDRLWETGFAD